MTDAQRRVTLMLIDEVYSRTDQWAEEARRQHPVRCQRGCAHCCNLLPVSSVMEGIRIVDGLGQTAWGEHRPKVIDYAAAVRESFERGEDWFYQANGCVFLHNNECRIYPLRPWTCRSHLVISDPELCKAESVTTITTINNLSLMENILSIELVAKNVLTMDEERLTLPLPHALLMGEAWLYDSKNETRTHVHAFIGEHRDFLEAWRAQRSAGAQKLLDKMRADRDGAH